MNGRKLFIAWHIILTCFHTKYYIHYIFCGIYWPHFLFPNLFEELRTNILYISNASEAF